MKHLGVIVATTALACAGMLAAGASVNAQQPDRQAAAVGASLFRAYCASCHGTAARGDGTVAEYLKVKPADLTKIAERRGGKYPLDEVRQIIDGRMKVKGHGHGEMPVWGDAFEVASGGATSEEIDAKIRNLAAYLGTIQKP